MKGTYDRVLWISVAAFGLFSALAGLRLLYGFDLWALRISRTRTSEFLDGVGEFFSTAGGIELTALALLALSAALYAGGRRTLAGRLLVAFLVTSLVEVAMKLWLPQTPIPEELSRSNGHTPLVEIGYSYPYPSGHMLRSVLLLGAVFLLWKNGLARTLVALALAGMALSRVYMGVHWASDVIGGALLGVAGLAWAFKHSAVSRQRSGKGNLTTES